MSFYMREHYDVFASFANNHFDVNILSCLRNVFIAALNKHAKLPRIISVILDDDILRYINHNKVGLSMEISTMLEWLFVEFDKALTTHVDQMPKKCKLANTVFPHFVWFGLPFNVNLKDNKARACFNKCLEQIAPQFQNVSVLLPKKGWDEFDRAVVSNNSFTAKGIAIYWRAIDAGILFWDTKKLNQVIQKTSVESEEVDDKSAIYKTSSTMPFKRSQGFKYQDFNNKHAFSRHEGYRPWKAMKKPSKPVDRFHFFKRKLPTPPPPRRSVLFC